MAEQFCSSKEPVIEHLNAGNVMSASELMVRDPGMLKTVCGVAVALGCTK